MSAVVTIGDCTLYHGDCLEVMPGLSDVDHIFADGPYEETMHRAKESGRNVRTDGGSNPGSLDFDSIEAIRDDVAALVCELAPKWFLSFCTPEGVAPWRDAIEGAGLRYKRACIWIKPDAAPQFNGQGPAMGAEMFVTAWCSPGVSRWNGGGKRGVWVANVNGPDRVMALDHETNKRRGFHPTQKPIELMRSLVADFTDPNEVVLDPFMGIGSTGVACAKLGRRFIGIEKHAHYFAMACERISKAYAQPDLFVAPPGPQPEQVALDLTQQTDQSTT